MLLTEQFTNLEGMHSAVDLICLARSYARINFEPPLITVLFQKFYYVLYPRTNFAFVATQYFWSL